MTKKGNYIKKEIKLRKRLEDIKIKLEGFKKIYELTLKKKGSNWIFVRSLLWASVRMLMPMIETLGRAYYLTNKAPQCQFLKRHLNIPCPNVVWNMYRHALIHDDSLRTINYKDKIFNWGISTKGEHIFRSNQINISVEKLCEDLLQFVGSELSSGKDLNKLIEVIVGIENPPHFIASELAELIKGSGKCK